MCFYQFEVKCSAIFTALGWNVVQFLLGAGAQPGRLLILCCTLPPPRWLPCLLGSHFWLQSNTWASCAQHFCLPWVEDLLPASNWLQNYSPWPSLYGASQGPLMWQAPNSSFHYNKMWGFWVRLHQMEHALCDFQRSCQRILGHFGLLRLKQLQLKSKRTRSI